jgi:lipopolysaccharide exporter
MSAVPSLGWQVVRNGGLVTLGQAVGMALRVGAQLLATHYLLPSDFGRANLALLVAMLLAVVVEGGLIWPTVRAGEDERATATALGLAVGLAPLLVAVAWWLGPVLAAVYAEPMLSDLIRVASLGVAAAALGATPLAILERRQRFRQRVVADAGGAVVGAAVTVGLALAGLGPLALVWGWVALHVVAAVLVWRLAGWRPRLALEWPAARGLLSLGGVTASSGLLHVAIHNVDDAMVGAVLGMQALGFYGLAFGWANMLARLTGGPLTRALFPSYLSIRQAPGSMAALFLGVMRAAVAVMLPGALGLALLGPLAVQVLLGPAWAMVGPLLQVLALLLLAHGVGLSQGALFGALDRMHWRTACLLAELVIIVVGVVPAATHGGVLGVAWLVGGAAMVRALGSTALATRALTLPAARLLASLAPPGLAALAALPVAATTLALSEALPPLIRLVVVGVILVGVYGLILLALWPRPPRPIVASPAPPVDGASADAALLGQADTRLG